MERETEIGKRVIQREREREREREGERERGREREREISHKMVYTKKLSPSILSHKSE